MKRVLFVDDEPKVLEGLRRMLRMLRREWEMEFAEGGHEALERLAASPFDVVVTDMRMPGMDGSELLKEVMARHPATVRIILSGQCDRDTVLQAVAAAHQFLTKPCDSETLKSTVARACRLRDQLPNEWHKETVSRITCVPSEPRAYAALKAELESPAASIERVRETIVNDVGMSAKVIQLTSTGFFGTPQRCSDPMRAVSLFDLDTIRAFAASKDIFAPFASSDIPARFLTLLAQHSVMVAKAARGIARAETSDRAIADDAYLGGLLHDIGLFVMAQHGPASYREMLAADQETPLWSLEHGRGDTSHSDVGGYLVGLWGLPDQIVQAVAWHHMPERAADQGFTPLTAVHVASALLDPVFGGLGDGTSMTNCDYLNAVGVAHRLPVWEDLCRDYLPEGLPS
jgi:HD-like signal output (HDOD) protein